MDEMEKKELLNLQRLLNDNEIILTKVRLNEIILKATN